MPIIELQNLNKLYYAGKVEVPALCDINLTIESGEMIAVTGPSGSGKSTLMNIIGLLDRPTEGAYKLDNELISLNMSDRKLARLRALKIGFVFQTFNLLPRITAFENVLLPTIYNKAGSNHRRQRAHDLLIKVGLEKRLRHKPSELSGGEKQRVAIARALVNNPDIILADEPTGNLDSKSGAEVIDILQNLNKEGKTIIIITHDDKIAARCQRRIRLFDGRIMEGDND